MCGIHAILSPGANPPREIPSELQRCLINRGPDYLGYIERRVEQGANSDQPTWTLSFTSTVLALRGDHVAKQPLTDSESGSVLCWNGEAWRIGDNDHDHVVTGNDGEAILSLLMKASASSLSSQDNAASGEDDENEAVLDVFRSIQGPFAFVYYQKHTDTIFFARDRLGRRSLMVHVDDAGAVTLSSIAEACDPSWKEVEADGIYVLKLSKETPSSLSFHQQIVRRDWVKGGDQASDFVSTSEILLHPS